MKVSSCTNAELTTSKRMTWRTLYVQRGCMKVHSIGAILSLRHVQEVGYASQLRRDFSWTTNINQRYSLTTVHFVIKYWEQLFGCFIQIPSTHRSSCNSTKRTYISRPQSLHQSQGYASEASLTSEGSGLYHGSRSRNCRLCVAHL